MNRVNRRAIAMPSLVAVLLSLALGGVSWRAASAQELVDLTLTFQGAAHGEIAPCG